MFNTLELHNFFSSPSVAKNRKQLTGVPPRSRQKWLAIALIGVNLALLLSFISGVNSYAAKGYEIKELQQKMGLLSEENQKLSVKVSEISSIMQIQSQLSQSDFVPVTGAKFLQVNQFSQR